MISHEEKLRLFEEIGMTGMVNKIKEEKEMKEEAEKLTAMKFKITNEETIRKQICGKYWEFDWLIDSEIPGFVVPFVGLVAGMLISLPVIAYDCTKTAFGIVGAGFFVGALAWVLSWRKTAELESRSLEAWTDKIPTGALYAVKEAKEKGLTDFRIYFPITEQRHRLITDPVIVGFYPPAKQNQVTPPTDYISGGLLHHLNRMQNYLVPELPKGKMIEIFAWDDGKIYE